MSLNLSTLKTPGVYIDEVPTLPSSIVGVETAIPAFIGYVEKMVINGKDIVGDANREIKSVRISSMKQYADIFGGPLKSETTLTVKIEETARMDGVRQITENSNVYVDAITASPKFLMYYQLQMYFANGGGPCYIIPVGSYTAAGAPDKVAMQKALEEILVALDEPTLIVYPDGVSLALASDLYALYQASLKQCAELKDRFVIIDLAKDDNITAFRAGIGNTKDQLRYGGAYHPWLKTGLEYVYEDVNVLIRHNINGTPATPAPAVPVAPAVPAPGAPPAPPAAPTFTGYDNLKLDAISQGTSYYNQIKQAIRASRLELPPSASMAGIYAFTDNVRGVWKAPANVGVNNITGLTKNYTDEEQKSLNVDENGGKSINIIRNFSGQGIVVWGARTLEGNSNEWRYVPVRRFFNFVEESVKKGMNNYVFEPNDANTWIKVRSTIESFLKLQWQAGALQGAKPEQAYFVRVGLGSTMSPDDILNGRLIVEIGMAVVRPAEFIVLRFMHKLAEA